ncbi:MAG: ComEC/Rec2 family competence protein [Bacteroidetes bacterium]|nr:ComEC/Rec2 family competence protein [Bacteroidota bacterium]
MHIIAISGMHLALINWLLARLFRPLLKRKRMRWLYPPGSAKHFVLQPYIFT